MGCSTLRTRDILKFQFYNPHTSLIAISRICSCFKDPYDGLNAPKYRRYVSAEKAPPHLCFDDGKERVCHVYTNASKSLSIRASFQVASNARERGDWCAYPIADSHCRIPKDLETIYNGSCTVECDLLDPSMLQGNSCLLSW